MSAPKNKSEITLRISGVSVATLDSIEALGDAQRPSVARNQVILFILDEIAAGRNPLDSLRPVEVQAVAA